MSDIIELHQFDLNGGRITKPRWAPNGRLLAVPMESGSIAILDTDSARVVQMVGQHSAEVISVGWNREAEFIMTGSLDRSIGVWRVNGGQRTGVVISGHKEPVHSVEWTDEGAFAMTCSPDRIRALDGFCLEAGWTREMEDRVNEQNGFSAASCSFRTTLLLAAAAQNGTLLILTSLVTGDVVGRIRMQQPVRSLAWSPKDDLVAAGVEDGILVFRAGQEGFEGSPQEFARNVSGLDALVFSGDGKLLVSHDSEGLKIWNAKTAKLVAKLDEKVELRSSPASAPSIAYHPTKPLVAAATANGASLRILDLSRVG